MTTKTVLEAICSGTFKLEFHSHDIGRYGKLTYFQKLLTDWTELAAGRNDGKWGENKTRSSKETDKRMRAFYQEKLDYPVSAKNNFMLYPPDIRAECQACGETLYWYVNKATKTVELCGELADSYEQPFKVKPEGKRTCPLAALMSIKDKIQVNSTLIFANFFGYPDCRKEDNYKEQWSLNTLIGCKNITHFKAKNNIAYGQMGNMGIALYFNKTTQEIIITNNYALEKGVLDDAEEEKKILAYRKSILKGFKKVGRISLAMWRWEAADLNTVSQAKLNKMKAEEYPQDIVELEVKHGTWEFEQFYGVTPNQGEADDFIYAKLKLVTP